jgi:hypothetical protein
MKQLLSAGIRGTKVLKNYESAEEKHGTKR